MNTRRTWPSLAVVAFAMQGWACADSNRAQQDPSVVATVNGEAISVADFEVRLLREISSVDDRKTPTPQRLEQQRPHVLETLVEEAILLQAARDAGVVVPREEVDRRILSMSSEYPANGFDATIARTFSSRSEFERATQRQLTIERLFDEHVYQRVAVPEDAIRREFADHADAYATAESIHAQHIVVKGLDDAKRVQQLLWQGKKFADVARKYSLGPEARVGGDLGWVIRGQLPHGFDEVIFRMAVGQTSDITPTEYGFHVFRVSEKKAAHQPELAEVRETVESRLLDQLRRQAHADFVAQLKKRSTVTLNNQVILASMERLAQSHSEVSP